MTVEGIHLKVVGNGIHGKNTRVWLGPEEVTNKVQSLELCWAADGITTATVRFLVADLDAEGLALPTWIGKDGAAVGFERRRRQPPRDVPPSTRKVRDVPSEPTK